MVIRFRTSCLEEPILFGNWCCPSTWSASELTWLYPKTSRFAAVVRHMYAGVLFLSWTLIACSPGHRFKGTNLLSFPSRFPIPFLFPLFHLLVHFYLFLTSLVQEFLSSLLCNYFVGLHPRSIIFHEDYFIHPNYYWSTSSHKDFL